MKYLLILLFIQISSFGFSQEFNLGGNLGIVPKNNSLILGASIGFKPNKSSFSINFDPNIVSTDKSTFFTFPLYLKVIVGDKIRFCPNVGGFWRTNSNFGLTIGLSSEYKISEKTLVFIKGDYMKDYYYSTYYDHFGGSYRGIESESSLWLSLGIKRNILK